MTSSTSMATAIALLTLLLKILSLGGRRGRASWWSWSATGNSLPAPSSLRVVLPLSRSPSPSSRFSLRRRLGSAESMCITRRSDVRVKVRSTRSHMTLERRRAPPIGPGSEEAARTRPRGASPTWHRRPSGIATARRWRRVVVCLIDKVGRQGRVCQLLHVSRSGRFRSLRRAYRSPQREV